jgi:type IV secretion system protein VirD4
LDIVRLFTDKEVADVQNIMNMIADPEGKGLADHWQKTGHALLVGTALHVLYAETNKTLAGCIEFLSNPARTIQDSLNYMLNTDHDMEGVRNWVDTEGKPTFTHPVVAAVARDMLNKAEEEMSSVVSTAVSYLTLYRDPIVARNTAFSEFLISDLMNDEKPVSLYLVVPPSDKDRLKPLIRLVVNQIIRSLVEKMEFKDGRSVAGYKHRLLLLIDEFPSLGKLDIFEESLAFIAGYGLKAYLIIQDISQLHTAYGKDESIFSNCHVRIAYAPNKVETAEMLSKMTGTATIVKQNNSYSGSKFGFLSQVQISSQETQRPLLTADEIMRLPAAKKDAQGNVTESGDMLIFMAGQTPIYGKQILYFTDPVFTQRAKVQCPTMSDRIRLPAAPTSSVETGQEPEMEIEIAMEA